MTEGCNARGNALGSRPQKGKKQKVCRARNVKTLFRHDEFPIPKLTGKSGKLPFQDNDLSTVKKPKNDTNSLLCPPNREFQDEARPVSPANASSIIRA
jgi:hypothetical protein